MFKRSLFCLTLLSAPLLASLGVYTTSRNIMIRAADQQAGTIHFFVDDVDLTWVSPEQPIFVQVQLQQGAVLEHTLVQQDGEDARLAQPLYLPYRIHADERFKVDSAADAVSIVRWAAGESAIWIKIQNPPILLYAGSHIHPGVLQSVEFVLGESAETMDMQCIASVNANLPFATRDLEAHEGQFSKAESQLLCVDTRGSSLVADNSAASGLKFEVNCFDGSADLGSGNYSDAGPHLACFESSHNVVAEGKKCYETSSEIQTVEIAGEEGLMILNQTYTMNYSSNRRNSAFWTVDELAYYPETSMNVRILSPGVGLDVDRSFFPNTSVNATALGLSPIEIGGTTYYRDIYIPYYGARRVGDKPTFQFKLYLVGPKQTEPIQVELIANMVTHEDVELDLTYPAAYQQPYCNNVFQAEPVQFEITAQGTVRSTAVVKPRDVMAPHRKR